MSRPSKDSGSTTIDLIETIFGLGTPVLLLIGLHLAALIAWIILLIRGGSSVPKTTKQH